MEVDTNLAAAMARNEWIHTATWDAMQELIEAKVTEPSIPGLARLLFENPISIPSSLSKPSTIPQTASNPAGSQPSDMQEGCPHIRGSGEGMAQAEAAWKYFERWRMDLKDEIEAAQHIRCYADMNQRMIARFWEIARSSTIHSATGGDEADAVSAMRLMIFLAARIKAVIGHLGSKTAVLPYNTLFGDVTKANMATAFTKALEARDQAVTASGALSIASLCSWTNLPTDAVTIKAFYLGLVTHRSPQIDPISSPLHVVLSNVRAKQDYLEDYRARDLDLQKQYVKSLKSVEATIEKLDL
jgi:hypothetical protein